MRKFFGIAFAGLLALGFSTPAMAAHNDRHHNDTAVHQNSSTVHHGNQGPTVNLFGGNRYQNQHQDWNRGRSYTNGWDHNRYRHQPYFRFFPGLIFGGTCRAESDEGYYFRRYSYDEVMSVCYRHTDGQCYFLGC